MQLTREERDVMSVKKVLRNYKKQIEEKGYNVLFIGLYGSQNYNLEHEESDYDARAIIMPSLRDIIKGKSTSKVLEFDEGLVDIKDILSYTKILEKGNPAFLEPLHSPYKLGNQKLIDMLSSYEINPMAVAGTMHMKLTDATRKAVNGVLDPKSMQHFFRLKDMVEAAQWDVAYLTYEGYDINKMNFIRLGISSMAESNLPKYRSYSHQAKVAAQNAMKEWKQTDSKLEEVYDFMEQQLELERRRTESFEGLVIQRVPDQLDRSVL